MQPDENQNTQQQQPMPENNTQPIISPQPVTNQLEPHTDVPSSQTVQPKKSKLRLLVVVVALVVIILLGAVGWLIYKNHHKVLSSTSNTSTHISTQNPTDLKTEQDLATLDTALQNYVSNQECATLPSSLSQLKLSPGKLNYPLANYQYTNQGADCGGPGDYQFQLCATFQSNTFTAASYNSFENNIPSGSPSAYSIHDSGKQCYTDGGGAYGPSFEIVLSNAENHLINETQSTNVNFSQLVSSIQSDYSSQAQILGFQTATNDIVKQCEVSQHTTSNNKKLYLCTIEAKKDFVTSSSPSTFYSQLQKLQTLNQSEGYDITTNPLGTFSQACNTFNSVTACNYSSSTKDSYCNLNVLYGAPVNPPNSSVTYELLCDNIPYTTQIPSGFKQVSSDDSIYNGGT